MLSPILLTLEGFYFRKTLLSPSHDPSVAPLVLTGPLLSTLPQNQKLRVKGSISFTKTNQPRLKVLSFEKI